MPAHLSPPAVPFITPPKPPQTTLNHFFQPVEHLALQLGGGSAVSRDLSANDSSTPVLRHSCDIVRSSLKTSYEYCILLYSVALFIVKPAKRWAAPGNDDNPSARSQPGQRADQI